jgi:hypothetical protein
MLKTLVASKAARLIATCVCPVAGTAGITMGVPQVRSAVHKATQPAPRAYAMPKTRAPEEAPIQTAAAPCLDLPTALSMGVPSPITGSDLPPAVLRPTAFTPPGTPPLIPGDPGGPVNPPPPPPPAIPEPATWVQLLLGFGLIGGIARMTMRPVDMRRNDEVEA